MQIQLNLMHFALLCLISASTCALPVAEKSAENSRKTMSHPRVKSSVTGKRRIIPLSDLPASPADLLRPDRFQFYTFDKAGEVITKQMTEREIQSLIAAGGGHFSPMAIEVHEPQKAGEVPTAGMKVSDVVQNVQNVLKSELSKPAPVMSSMPTIPGHANEEWSNILPSILSGDMETAPVAPEDSGSPYLEQEERIPVMVGSDYDGDEKPMIQVPVITVEEKESVVSHPIINKSEQNPSNDEQSSGPIFQILNTISADQVKNGSHDDQMTGASEASTQLIPTNKEENVISIVSETHSTSVKIPGKEEIKINNESMVSSTSTGKPVDYDGFEKIPEVKPESPIEVTTMKIMEVSSIVADDAVDLKVNQTVSVNVDEDSGNLKNVTKVVEMTTEEPKREDTSTTLGSSESPIADVTHSTSTTESIPLSTKIPMIVSSSTETVLSTTQQSVITTTKKPEENPLPTDLNDEEKTPTTESSTSQPVTEFVTTTIENEMENKFENETKLNSNETNEAPIVRIDIMETKPTTEVLRLNQTEENSTESPVVRIQLTDTVSTVNRIIEKHTDVDDRVIPEVEHLTLPPVGSVGANGIGSSLIAGAPNDDHPDEQFDDDDSIIIDLAKKGAKPTDDEPMKEQPQRTDDSFNPMIYLMEKINFNELPIVSYKKNSVKVKKNETKTESQVIPQINETKNETLMEPQVLPQINKTKNEEKLVKVDKSGVEANETFESAVVRIDDHAELPMEPLIPTGIKLTDLPLVPKLPKPEMNNSLSKDDKNDEKPVMNPEMKNSTHEDDPYEKLGEPIELSNNSSFKVKDQKKDSSMEKLPSTSTPKPTETLSTPMKNTSAEEPEKWTLIPQKLPSKPETQEPSTSSTEPPKNKESVPLDDLKTDGLDSSTKSLEPDISYFANLCNDLAFSFWSATNAGLSTARSLALSPFGMTSMLAMIFLGARGSTSEQMNNLLKLDDVASFNPHLVFQNVTDSLGTSRKQGIANAAFVREVFADRIKVRKLLPFYKEQAQQFYDGVVAEVNFATISDLVRRRTNLMVRKQTGGRIKDFVKGNTVPMRSPLAALSANVFQTDCNTSYASSDGRDGELYFAVSPAIRQRKLIPVPATVWRAGVFAGYEPNLDATAIALGGADKIISTIFVIPGQQGFTAHGDNLELLEERLMKGAAHDNAWNKLLKVIIPRPGLELQIPKFSHRSVVNATAALKRMGLHDLFQRHANLKGINGFGTDLHLTDVLQMNLFSTCGDENILSGRHHVEVYPAPPQRNARDSSEIPRKFGRDRAEGLLASRLVSKLNESIDKPRLKLDRPFLYFVRHNPTGLILHMGRFNPRLLP